MKISTFAYMKNGNSMYVMPTAAGDSTGFDSHMLHMFLDLRCLQRLPRDQNCTCCFLYSATHNCLTAASYAYSSVMVFADLFTMQAQQALWCLNTYHCCTV